MVALGASLSKLSESAARLNEETDSFNELIVELDTQLAEMNVGVTVWDQGHGSFDGGWLLDETVHSTRNETPTSVGESTGWVAGYTKFPEGWGLAAKQVTVISGYFEGDTECPFLDVKDDFAAVPLTQAPRLVRVAAAGRLESLFEQLGERVEWFTKGIESAKRLATE